MMGWVMLVLLAAVAAALLWAIGFPRRLWTIAATALTLGAAGYAWQGSPGLPDNSAKTASAPIEVDPDLVQIREAMFGRFNTTYFTLMQSDAMMRIGAPDSAARAMLIGTYRTPNDPGVWTGLGTALAESDKGVSPASRFAFDRAMAIYPEHPGPPFFLGLALVRANQFGEARQYWAKAVALTPANASYRQGLEVRLALLDRFLAEAGAAQPQTAPPAP
jgi:cytochrome c-type biogenesis protein CcmH